MDPPGLCLPPSAAGTFRFGHGAPERWLDEHGHRYRVDAGGSYRWEHSFPGVDGANHVASWKNPPAWIDAAAHTSHRWYWEHFADGRWTGSEAVLRRLAPELIAHTLRYGAGFIRRFFAGLPGEGTDDAGAPRNPGDVQVSSSKIRS